MFRHSLVVLACLTAAASAAPAPAPTSATPAPTAASTPAAATPAPATSATPAASSALVASGPKITFSQCHVDGPYIAMTFDDGPHGANTPRLLDMLKERKIHATFFMVGQCAQEFPAIVKRIVAEGHEVGNHSWSHPQLSAMNDAAVHDQLQKTEDAIVAACGVKPKLMRPPYGAFTARQRNWAFATWGYKCILWDVDPLDWKIRNADHVKSEILKQTVQGSIILSHDIHKTTIDAMPETLDTLLGKGYKFVTVSELIAMDHPPVPKPKASPAPKEAKDTTKTKAPTGKTDAAESSKTSATPAATPAAKP